MGAASPWNTVVALTTSSNRGALSVLLPSGERREEFFPPGLVHGREIIPRLKTLLERESLGPETIDLLVVDLGPGSYTGIRVGVATARTLAFAVDADVIGIPSLEILAAGIETNPPIVCSLIDARRELIHRGLYRRGNDGVLCLDGSLAAIPLADLPDQIPAGATLVGDGVCKLPPSESEPWTKAPETHWTPRPEVLLELGLTKARAEHSRGSIDSDSVVPLYLRPSEAELNYARKRSS